MLSNQYNEVKKKKITHFSTILKIYLLLIKMEKKCTPMLSKSFYILLGICIWLKTFFVSLFSLPTWWKSRYSIGVVIDMQNVSVYIYSWNQQTSEFQEPSILWETTKYMRIEFLNFFWSQTHFEKWYLFFEGVPFFCKRLIYIYRLPAAKYFGSDCRVPAPGFESGCCSN